MIFSHICVLCNKVVKLPYQVLGMFICDECIQKIRNLLGIKLDFSKSKNKVKSPLYD